MLMCNQDPAQSAATWYLSNWFSKNFEGGRIVLNHGDMVGILRTLRECRHHCKSFFQQAAVLTISCFVSNELLKMLQQKFQQN